MHTKPHMYADDTMLNAAAISTSELHFKVNEDLENIRNWLLSNKLKLNSCSSGLFSDYPT